jgi:hypothetical protein
MTAPLRRLATASLIGVLTVTLGLGAARADEGTLVLLDILTNSFAELSKLDETIVTMRRTYGEAKKLASYADDASRAFKSFEKMNADVFSQDVADSLERAFPDVGYYRREASRTGPWAEGTGELQRLVAFCIRGEITGRGAACATLEENITTAQARKAISATFGTMPPVAGSVEVRAVDHEAASAVSASFAQTNRDAVTRARAKALLSQCESLDGSEGEDTIAACQAAANSAQIAGLAQAADLTDSVAELTRLEAVRAAQENARRKREVTDVIEQRAQIIKGAEEIGIDRGAEVRTEGVRIFDEGP